MISVESADVVSTRRGRSLRARLACTGVAVAAVALSACSGGSGADVEQNPGLPGSGPTSNYNGPPPSTADVQQFKINLWDNIQADNRCGTCHSDSGGQAPMFARRDDINLAYSAANGVVTLATPPDSTMVGKVGGGHNCWLASNDACGEILTTWITNWAGGTSSTAARKIELEPPVLRDPGQSKNFPVDQGALFSTTVYPLLTQHCAECHASDTALKQQPFFAENALPPDDADALALAYEAAKSKMNLDDPSISRFVLRLRNESHNCWTASCTNDANAMQTQIQTFSNGVLPTSVDPNLITSKATTLYEGTIASGGNRYEANVIAMYEFKTGQDCGTSIMGVCSVAYDTSGVEPAMDLTLSGNVQWFGGWGLNFAGGKAQASTGSSAKLKNLILSTGEYSIEAWVAPGNVVQEDMRIISYSASLTNRNFNLGQTMYNYDFFNRTNLSSANGDPQLSTPDADEVLQATLQHVVATFHPVTGRRIYVNGELVAQNDPTASETITSWDTSYAFVLGNEVSGNRMWNGVIRRRRPEILPDVRRRASHEHQRQLRRVRSRAVRQLRLPVQQTVLHQLGRDGRARWARRSRLASRLERRRSARRPRVLVPRHEDHDRLVLGRDGPDAAEPGHRLAARDGPRGGRVLPHVRYAGGADIPAPAAAGSARVDAAGLT
jgi:mono/diheme cytochrome c family protein